MFSVKQKVLIARGLNRVLVAARRCVGLGPLTVTNRRGIRWSLDLNEGIDLCIYLLGAYEPRTVWRYSPLIESGFVVLDIGANVGSHTLQFARLVGPTGRVFAFEPTDFAFAKLKRNVGLNPQLAPSVIASQTLLVAEAAAAAPEALYASWPLMADPDGLHREHLGKAMPIAGAAVITADEFCRRNGLTRIDFVKLDVDGNEFEVLKGFVAALEKFRPRILMEIAPYVLDERSANLLEELTEFLVSLRYQFLMVNSRQPIIARSAALRSLVGAGDSINILLEPKAV